ncbi:DUF3221 domain-containing protein [Clostridium sp. D2Q-11]|uniref:DUF3221 domain-containing protein n=1 Tax=Anaeromonas frigoriresistens TaxID=2683708 RepID=A0A942UT76_9FIRM|nr:DUF3221 domain-containing protein [Anaeromonas frigoriresistens]MBS4537525.1 DUF3221 domain-containing protein [Anaeromonas frigoriresistens]
MKKFSIFLIIILLMISIAGCTQDSKAPSSDDNSSTDGDSQFVEYGVAGNITEITVSEDDSILGTIHVEGPKDNGATYDNAIVTVLPDTKIYSNDTVNFKDLEVGMYVEIFFKGEVKESYPVQADAKQINIIPDDPVKNESDEQDGE